MGTPGDPAHPCVAGDSRGFRKGDPERVLSVASIESTPRGLTLVIINYVNQSISEIFVSSPTSTRKSTFATECSSYPVTSSGAHMQGATADSWTGTREGDTIKLQPVRISGHLVKRPWGSGHSEMMI